MDFELVLMGAIIGLVAVAPLGPVNFIVIRATLRRGLGKGMLAGLGSVVGDGIFGGIAAYGVRWIEDFVKLHSLPLQTFCGVVLVIMGVRMARTAKQDVLAFDHPLGAGEAALVFLATFSLTITNPATLMGFLALFGSMGSWLDLGAAAYRPAQATAGVMLGSFTWWLFIGMVAWSLRTRLTPTILRAINRWVGVLITAFGFVLLFNALY